MFFDVVIVKFCSLFFYILTFFRIIFLYDLELNAVDKHRWNEIRVNGTSMKLGSKWRLCLYCVPFARRWNEANPMYILLKDPEQSQNQWGVKRFDAMCWTKGIGGRKKRQRVWRTVWPTFYSSAREIRNIYICACVCVPVCLCACRITVISGDTVRTNKQTKPHSVQNNHKNTHLHNVARRAFLDAHCPKTWSCRVMCCPVYRVNRCEVSDDIFWLMNHFF